ncbi:MAG: hypothetical protein QME27_05490 [Syntrophaceae bacterium]|nr:hypothetical protein [Syntrophaceae bacterium]
MSCKKHNLVSKGGGVLPGQIPFPSESHSRAYYLSAEHPRTYAELTQNKRRYLIEKILTTFPGSRVLSEEEAHSIPTFSGSGSYSEERPGRETASEHTHAKTKALSPGHKTGNGHQKQGVQLAFSYRTDNGGAL